MQQLHIPLAAYNTRLCYASPFSSSRLTTPYLAFPPLLFGLSARHFCLRINSNRTRPKPVSPSCPSMTIGEIVDEEPTGTPFLERRTPANLSLSMNSKPEAMLMTDMQDHNHGCDEFALSERRRSLFEPLGPKRSLEDRSPESLLPPPDFDRASYPRGWVVGKKRKLVNVDVVESMRRIAIHEMNRKDREIDCLNEQLEEDARTMEHLQLQFQQERQKRVQVERENSVLQDQVALLMNMLSESEEAVDIEILDGSQLINA